MHDREQQVNSAMVNVVTQPRRYPITTLSDDKSGEWPFRRLRPHLCHSPTGYWTSNTMILNGKRVDSPKGLVTLASLQEQPRKGR
jgi:hypothetical protein